MTQRRPSRHHRRPTRRQVLSWGAGLGAGLALPGCAYLKDVNTAAPPIPPGVKAEIDGDLVYFNWADYLDPDVMAGFEKEYGVRLIQSNFDSMEGMVAKLNAGNKYDIIFPGAKWVQMLRQQGKLRRIEPDELTNADQVFGFGGYFEDPWYDPGSAVSIPFTVYKTGIGWRTDKVDTMTGSWRDLWNEQASGRIYTLDNQDEAIAVAALMLELDPNTADPDDLEQIKDLLLSQKPYLRAYSADDIKNMETGDAWIHHMWSGDFLFFYLYRADNPADFAFESPTEGAPINSDAYAIPANAEHPGTAMVFIDYLLRPENVVKNVNYLGYPFPVRDGAEAFEALAKEVPACNVDVADLENPTVFELLPPADVQARSAMWTEVKAG